MVPSRLMRADGIINAQLARVLAELRHTDWLVVADSGLPVPDPGPEVIDLAVVYGVPAFAVVFEAVLSELVVEEASAAEEIVAANPECWELIRDRLSVDVGLVPHETFKAEAARARAVVRTGEATPYANVILQCGVPFG
jgi:D-ribose pyranase